MVRRITFGLLFFISISCFAQKHMKFMGIPIDGNVYSFCEQLKKIGFKPQSENKSSISYIGKFYGEDASVDVTYAPSNKKVYQVSVSIIKKHAFELRPLQKEIMLAIEDKYTTKKEMVNQQLSQYDYYIFDRLDPIGMIQMFILDTSAYREGGESMLSISYTDVENYMQYEGNRRKDI